MEQQKTIGSASRGSYVALPDLRNDERLARILDGGTIEEWRTIYDLLSRGDEGSRSLQERIYQLLLQVPTSRPYVWLTVLTSLGYPIDWTGSPRQAAADVPGAEIGPGPRCDA